MLLRLERMLIFGCRKQISPKISQRKEALKMEKNSRSRNNRIQKTNGMATVGVVKNDGDSPAIAATTQTPLEARFT